MRLWKSLLFLILLSFSLLSFAQKQPIAVKMYKVTRSEKGRFIGVIIVKETPRGLLLVPRLRGLPPGYHGFHLHQNPSCKNQGKAAGGHWDPKKTGHHRGPYRSGGHQGDLPALYVDANGLAKLAVLAPRLTIVDLPGHALVIHEGGDNYTDNPPNGGGGARIACGVVR